MFPAKAKTIKRGDNKKESVLIQNIQNKLQVLTVGPVCR